MVKEPFCALTGRATFLLRGNVRKSMTWSALPRHEAYTTRQAQCSREEHRVDQPLLAFWSLSTPEMLQQLQAIQEGLTDAEATQRLARYGANLLPPKRSDVLTLLLAQFKSPIILILVFATGLSFFSRMAN